MIEITSHAEGFYFRLSTSLKWEVHSTVGSPAYREIPISIHEAIAKLELEQGMLPGAISPGTIMDYVRHKPSCPTWGDCNCGLAQLMPERGKK